jgi:hypothetical protein
MLKWLIISINFIVVLLINGIFQQNITVQMSAPTTVTGGDEFQVQLTLKKGDLSSFSRLLQELPAGLKAKSINSANADFTFKDNKVRLIWIKLPETEDVTITYTIHVDPRLKGTFNLGGKFSYISNNERQSVDISPQAITINPNPNTDSSLIVDIKDFKEKIIPELTSTENLPIVCIRETPEPTGEADNGYIVNLLVNKENAQKFAKIEEQIPKGFTAIKIDAKEGIFTFKNGYAKYLWMNLPSSPYFIVSYRLVPGSGVVQPPVLKGKFSYVIDDKTYVTDIVQKDLKLASFSSDEVKKLVTEISTSAAPMLLASQEQINDTTQKKLAANNQTDTTKIAQQPVKLKKKWLSKNENQNLAYTLEPEQGVYFRVQIAAGHKYIDIKRYFKKFKIGDEIRTENHEGWHKYSIGSFNEYRQARDYRVHIWNTTPINDAFVSAYNSGTRITVQEALMITNQKWYK